ncbi:thioesterase superfamily protein [Seiridium cupressi]
MKYRGGYSIKDLRRDLDGGLGWAHSTESVANYLETIANADSAGSFRHTSSQDKTDPKKVVTTSFYKARGGKVATCHAHGDGTWSIAFTGLGQDELKKQGTDAINASQLDVNIRAEVKADGLYHHGEMKNKPLACRGYVSLNNDEVHQVHHAGDQIEVVDSSPVQKIEGKTDPKAADLARKAGPVGARSATQWFRYQQDRERLSPRQLQLASDLAKEGLSKKEERSLFQSLKAMPWDEQEQVLKRSKALKTQIEGETRNPADLVPDNGDIYNMDSSSNLGALDLEHFQKISWCAEHLGKPGVKTWIPPRTRVPNADGEHVVWSKTLNDPEAFSAFLAFYTKPEESSAMLDQVNVLLSCGKGLQGHPGFLHGGIVAAILDEVSGLLPTINRGRKALPNVSYMTGYLNITFKRPVRTPGTIMAIAKVSKVEGRRLLVKGTVQDGEGAILAESDVLFIALKHLL